MVRGAALVRRLMTLHRPPAEASRVDVGQIVEDLRPILTAVIRGPWRLEVTTAIDPTWNDQSEAAHVSLGEWQAAKAEAAASGRDMVAVLADLTRERSHRANG